MIIRSDVPILGHRDPGVVTTDGDHTLVSTDLLAILLGADTVRVDLDPFSLTATFSSFDRGVKGLFHLVLTPERTLVEILEDEEAMHSWMAELHVDASILRED